MLHLYFPALFLLLSSSTGLEKLRVHNAVVHFALHWGMLQPARGACGALPHRVVMEATVQGGRQFIRESAVIILSSRAAAILQLNQGTGVCLLPAVPSRWAQAVCVPLYVWILPVHLTVPCCCHLPPVVPRPASWG